MDLAHDLFRRGESKHDKLSATKSRQRTGFYLDDTGVSRRSFLVACMHLVHLVFVLKGVNTGCYNVDAANTAETLLPVLPHCSPLNASRTE